MPRWGYAGLPPGHKAPIVLHAGRIGVVTIVEVQGLALPFSVQLDSRHPDANSGITHVEHVSRGSDRAQSAANPRYMMYLRLAGEA